MGELDFALALRHFERAYQKFPSPKLLVNIGTTLRHLGRNAEASEAYRRYLESDGAEPARAAELTRILDEIELVTGTVELRVADMEATVRVDERVVPLTGRWTSIRVDPGEHILTLQTKRGETAVEVFDTEAGEVVRVGLEVPPRAQQPPKIVILTDETWVQPTAGWSVFGVGVGGLIGGTVFGLLARSSYASAADDCSATQPGVCDETGAALDQEARTQSTLSTVSFVAGGLLAATGVVVVLTSPTDAEPPNTTATITPGGVAMTWSW